MINNSNIHTKPGYPLPAGACQRDSGVNFSIFSRNASAVSLILFDSPDTEKAGIEIELDPVFNRTGDIWHIHVSGISEGQLYGYRIDGPWSPAEGHRFNRNCLLIDPCARALSGNFQWNLRAANAGEHSTGSAKTPVPVNDTSKNIPRGIVVFDRPDTGDRPLNLDEKNYVIYELHVRGFTAHPSAGTSAPGTFLGLTEKIPYLRELGINAVELMPVQEFDQDENININPVTGERLKNYWGYNTLAFFAPKGRYSSSGTMGEQVIEFRNMVSEFHRAGIEVIMDVVYNHTAEGGHTGPTVSFRGIDNSIYYMLMKDRGLYRNYSGCGNTFNCNHPLVREFILESLRYWVTTMHIDGFRFDLASILGRDPDGRILSNPPLIDRIEQDPILRNTRIIAEAWDAAGAYQVGEFPGRWAEWNGKYRDDIRRFWRGDTGSTGAFATRITGSSDLYQESGRTPFQSINFVTCHDGFTLNDLVCYSHKHNIENGEGNLDGENHNLSMNFGIEGPDAEPGIKALRSRQIKNFIATLFLSQGTPMLLSGDEFRRTQHGNNNAYCQDNEISWVDWALLEKNTDLFRFTREMIRFRREHPVLTRSRFLSGNTEPGFSAPDSTWHDPQGMTPSWKHAENCIALLLNGAYAGEKDPEQDSDILCIFNATDRDVSFTLPPSPSGNPWKRAVDTSFPPPDDITDAGEEKIHPDNKYMVLERSTVVLIT